MKKFLVMVLIIVSIVVAKAFEDSPLVTTTGLTSISTDSNVTWNYLIDLKDEDYAVVVTSLTGGSGSMINNYKGYVSGSWVVLYRDTISAVGTRTFELRNGSTVNVEASQILVESIITNSSGTQTLKQQLTAW